VSVDGDCEADVSAGTMAESAEAKAELKKTVGRDGERSNIATMIRTIRERTL